MECRPSCFCTSSNNMYAKHIIFDPVNQHKHQITPALWLTILQQLAILPWINSNHYPDLQGLRGFIAYFSSDFTSFSPIIAHFAPALQLPYSYPTHYTSPDKSLCTLITIFYPNVTQLPTVGYLLKCELLNEILPDHSKKYILYHPLSLYFALFFSIVFITI